MTPAEATGRRQVNLKYAHRRPTLDGQVCTNPRTHPCRVLTRTRTDHVRVQGFSPRVFDELPGFLNLSSRAGSLHRALDFASPDAAVSRSGVLFAEFDAPELPPFTLVGKRFSRNLVNGQYDSEARSARRVYARDLPCFLAQDISGFMEPCPPLPGAPVPLNQSYCKHHADAMRSKVKTLSQDLLRLQTAYEDGTLTQVRAPARPPSGVATLLPTTSSRASTTTTPRSPRRRPPGCLPQLRWRPRPASTPWGLARWSQQSVSRSLQARRAAGTRHAPALLVRAPARLLGAQTSH